VSKIKRLSIKHGVVKRRPAAKSRNNDVEIKTELENRVWIS